jgi:OOP family OmpA-OmpF porin
MMMKKKLTLLLAGSLLAMATAATAGNKAETFSVSPVIGGISFGANQHMETAPLIGIRAGYNFTKEIGVEALFDYALTEYKITNWNGSKQKVDFFRYGAEVLYHFMPDSSFVPYIAVGAGGTNFGQNTPEPWHGSPANTGKGMKGLVDYGVGAKFFMNDRIALRGDVRHLLYDLDNHHQALEYTVGLYFPFGGAAKAVQQIEPPTAAPVAGPIDSDGDGVPDYLDKCPDTPAGVAVDKDGCPPVAKKVVILATEPMVEEKVVSAVSQKKAEVVVLVFEDVHFDFDQSTLKPEAKVILKRDIKLLKDNPNTKIRVAGYTSASGTEEYNQKLSERRAKAVEEYLINEGIITRSRLTMIGYGEHNPAVYESSPKELYSPAAKANMRVLFEIVVQ